MRDRGGQLSCVVIGRSEPIPPVSADTVGRSTGHAGRVSSGRRFLPETASGAVTVRWAYEPIACTSTDFASFSALRYVSCSYAPVGLSRPLTRAVQYTTRS